MKERIVCIEWEDAAYNSGYYDKKSPEDFTPITTRTVGHLVRRTPKSLIVAQDRFYKPDGKPEDDRHIGIIPRKMIKKITELR
uniref:Uncharacterized protein n=1 Tax=viral metagenome TaxID=1070528 RepID=A0A6M3J9S5_9ZZZZ